MFRNRGPSLRILAAAGLCLNCHSWQLASQPIQEVVPANPVGSDHTLEVRVYLQDGEHVDLDRPTIADGRLHGITRQGESWDVGLDSVSTFKVRRFDTAGTVLLVTSVGLFVLLGASGDYCCCGGIGLAKPGF